MPEGPLTIAISLAEQELKIYDANGLFVESRISSGKAGHSTPRGVFSIIQKRKWHRSNLYANAPMPYMQRITWSGVALHAGVVPGYPASHGCVRLPHAFAAKLWRWTRMGARVIITHGELAPVDVEHALLPARLPPDVATPAAEVTAKDAKKTENALGLRLTLDDSDPLAGRVRTADASNAIDGEPVPVEGDRDEFDAGDEVGGEAPAMTGGVASRDKASEGHWALDAAMWSYWPSGAVTAMRPPPVGRGHVAMFISRKDGRLYVRRDFQPWFDVPVSIKDADRTLGTHVFTARVAGEDKRALRWSAISVSEPVVRQDLSARKSKRGRADAETVTSPPPPAPTAREALDRVAMPDGVLAAITPLLDNGASLVISDKGPGPETGKGTDFIVLTR